MRTATLPTVVKPSQKTSINPYLRSAVPAAEPEEKDTKAVRLLRKTLITLVILLTFEGLLRKLEPNKIGIVIFLLKDVVILFMGLQLITRHRLNAAINFLSIGYLGLVLFLLPCIINTGSHDPLLAIFGAKEYLLYPIVALSVFVVFENASMTEVIRFCRLVAFLMIPAGLVAIVQTQLSPNNWLNLSVDGASLEDFSSAGHLRVSSTFSFVSQFCCFLNMQMFMVFLALHGYKNLKGLKKLVFLLPIPLLVISSYLTGSRGAVIGNSSVLVIAVILACLRFELGKIIRFVWIAGAIVVVVLVFQTMFPSLMATYTVREKGHAFGVSTEIWGRVYEAFFGWLDNVNQVPFFGNGLGIMSNGSDAISPYSRTFRLQGWTETDIATTLFEGGPYLIFVWYAFRYYIIFATTRRFLFQTKKALFLPGAFCQAFIILVGMTGTLGIQPPIAIWWWLAVGLSVIMWWRSIHPMAGEEEVVPVRPAVAIRRAALAINSETTPPVEEPAQPTPKFKPAKAAKPASAVEPTPPSVAPAPPAPVVRGRSSYADRLHREK
jgi:hypothetical protein